MGLYMRTGRGWNLGFVQIEKKVMAHQPEPFLGHKVPYFNNTSLVILHICHPTKRAVHNRQGTLAICGCRSVRDRQWFTACSVMHAVIMQMLMHVW